MARLTSSIYAWGRQEKHDKPKSSFQMPKALTNKQRRKLKHSRRNGVDRVVKAIWKAREEHVERVGIRDWKEKAATKMRNKPTRLERILATSLNLNISPMYTIYRQWVQSGYILDFYVRELLLCFEADGPLHEEQYDRARDQHIQKRGIRTIRFTEDELDNDLETVDATIRREVARRINELKK